MLTSLVAGLRGSVGEEESPQSRRRVVWMDLDIVDARFVFAVIAYSNGFDVYHLHQDGSSRLVCAKVTDKDGSKVSLMKILPAQDIRNIAVAETGSGVVEFIDMSSLESYHVIRLTALVVNLHASKSAIAIAIEGGRIHIFDSLTLEEKFSVRQGSKAWDLSHRWIAYNIVAQQMTGLSQPSLFGRVWQKLSAISQDAFDNVVLAVSHQQDHPGMSSLQSPTRTSAADFMRNGIVAIQDCVSQKILATIDDQSSSDSRPIECLKWSDCGSMILTTSGNGHYVCVYGMDWEMGRSEIIFSLKATLNRGMTPAIITGICMDAHRQFVAVCSGNGSIHIFNATSGERVTKISTAEKDISIKTHNQNQLLFLINRRSQCVEHYTVNDSGAQLTHTVEGLAREPESRQEVGLDSLLEKSASPKQERTVEVGTFNPSPVEAWQSPLLSFWKVREDGNREELRFRKSSNVTYDTSAVSFHDMQTEIEAALNTPLISQDECEEDKYAHTTTKEGFVQLVPRTVS